MKPALWVDPQIDSYPVLLLLGFIASWLLARRRARHYGIESRHVDNLGLILPLAGLFGARLFARIFYAKLPLLEALKVWEGDGLVFYGGFLAASSLAAVYGLTRHLSLVTLGDTLAPAVALGLALGRVGCFFAGCCWGNICYDSSASNELSVAPHVYTVSALSPPLWPLTVRFPPKSLPFKQHVRLGLIPANAANSLPVHPVQLYEAVCTGGLCLWLHYRFRGQHPGGNAAISLVAGYAIIRFFTECLRADNKPYSLGLTFSQVVSLDLLLFCFFSLLLRWIFFSRLHSSERRSRSAALSRRES